MYNKEVRRTRLVTFRVSPEEYQTLEAACTAHHLRSVSDLTRDAVQQWIQASDYKAVRSQLPVKHSAGLDSELELMVEACIQTINHELQRLQHLVQLRRSLTNQVSSPPSIETCTPIPTIDGEPTFQS